MTAPSQTQRRTLIRFGTAMAVGNLVWEIAQVPLYTLWLTGTSGEIAFDVMHCMLGDIVIAAVCLGGALSILGRHGWPERGYAKVATATVVAALCYTVFSEWLNVEVRGSWAYRELMPTLPILGTGISPVLQWLVVPIVSFWWAKQDDSGKS